MVTVGARCCSKASRVRPRVRSGGAPSCTPIAAAIPLAASRRPRLWRSATSTTAARWSSSPSTAWRVHDFWWVTLLSFGPVLIVARAGDAAACGGARAAFGIFGGARGVVRRLLFLRQRPRSPGRLRRLARRPLPVHGGRGGDRRAVRTAAHADRRRIAAVRSGPASRSRSWPGLPTTVIDIYNTQDITNHSEAPAGSLDADADAGRTAGLRLDREQHRPGGDRSRSIRSRATRSTGPTCRPSRERRMAVGLPISMVPLAKYQQASEAIRTDLRRGSRCAAYERAVRAGVNYVIVGPPERDAHPGVEATIQLDRRTRCRWSSRTDTISIYEVARSDGSASLASGPRSLRRSSISCRTPSGASRAAAPTIAAAR